jgi:hypothetical protein
MGEFLTIISSYPTVIFTVLVGVAVLYWGMVVLGAFDIDLLDVGDGGADGLGEGAAEGATDALGEGAAEAATEGATEGAAGAGTGTVAGLLSALRLRSAPLTVVLSLIFFFSWLICFLAMRFVAPLVGALLPNVLLGTVALVVALGASVPLASLMSRPLGRFFVIHQAPGRGALIGKVCTVDTGTVNEGFGQANYDDGGAGMVLQVRCDPSRGLKKGSVVLIVAYDGKREAFLVEPYEEMLARQQDQSVKEA